MLKKKPTHHRIDQASVGNGVLGVRGMPVYFLLGFGAVWPVMLSTARAVHARWLHINPTATRRHD